MQTADHHPVRAPGAATFLTGLALLALAACGGGGGAALDDGGGGGGGSGGGGSAAFPLTVDPASLQVPVGGAADAVVEVVPDPDFQAPVQITVVGFSNGLVAELAAPDPGVADLPSGGSVDLQVTADPGMNPAAALQVQLRAVGGGIQRDVVLTVEVVAASFDFAVRAGDGFLALSPGRSTATRCLVEPIRGTPEPVTLSVPAPPAGVTVTVSGPAERPMVQFEADGSLAVGDHEVVVEASTADLTRTTRLLLHGLPAPVDDLGIRVVPPARLQIERGATAAAQVDLVRELGVTGDFAVAVAGLPSGVLASWDQNPVVGAVSLLQLTATASALVGVHAVTVTATQGGVSGSAAFLLEVVPDGAAADPRIQRVELAQSVVGRDPALVAGKDLLLRTHVTAAEVGLVAPALELVAYDSQGQRLGSEVLSAPLALWTGERPATLAESYTVTLPGSWVASGLELWLELDPAGVAADGERGNNRVRVVPDIGSRVDLDLVVVPLRLAGRDSQAQDLDAAIESLWPVSQVSSSVRARYTVTSVADISSNGDGWTQVLSEIASLRQNDGSTAYYYGVVPVNYSSGVAGIGYVGLPVAIGWHRTTSVALHELGHNFGLRHAPCGGPANPDQDYPFGGAVIGAQGYDARTASLIDPLSTRDLMSYCGPDWVSEHNVVLVRQSLGGALSREGGSGPGPEVPQLLVRGRLLADGSAVFDGVTRTLAPRAVDAPGRDPSAAAATLRVAAESGTSAAFPLRLLEIGCGPGAQQRAFVAQVPDLGAVRRLEVVDSEGRVLGRIEAGRSSLPEGVAAARAALDLELQEQAGRLMLRWDADAWPELAVTHVAGSGRRHTLGLRLVGGEVDLDLSGCPAGGWFEIAAARGLDGFVERFAR